MIEFDLDTDEGREKAKEQIRVMLEKSDKHDLGELLFFMLNYIAEHEVKFNNLKNVL